MRQFQFQISGYIFICICLVISLNACRNDIQVDPEEQTEQEESYLKKWTGTYDGVSTHWMNAPLYVDSVYQFTHQEDTLLAHVVVTESIQDSCLDMDFYYDGVYSNTRTGLKFDMNGAHHSTWGAASSYGSMVLQFQDSILSMGLFQKCGIPCESGIYFALEKNE